MRPLRKVLCSIGTGPHVELLALSGMSFRAYAERHGYELRLETSVPASDRPVSWSKVTLLRRLLETYDLAVWIDADAAVVDPTVDIADSLHGRDLMGLVGHRTEEGDDPILNCGVWVLRSHRLTRRFLEDVWNSTGYIGHRWWENAAVLDLLGYRLEPRVALSAPTRMLRRTRILPLDWNSIPVDASEHPRIVHFPGAPLADRLAGLTDAVAWAAAAEV